MQNDFSPAVHLFKPLSTSSKKDKTIRIHNLVTPHQFFKNIFKHLKLWKYASIFFILHVRYKYIQMKSNLEINRTQPLFFFFPVLFKADTCNVFQKRVRLFCAQLCGYYEKVSHLQNNFLSKSSVTAYVLFAWELITLVWVFSVKKVY